MPFMIADLNLLRTFDVLMEVRSVSRAAARLGLTQSAVSHALARLREQLGDALFIRVRGGLRPTPRASEIAPSIREGLSRLQDALSFAPFDPACTPRSFTISASSYFCVTLLPAVIDRARAEAPFATFRISAPSNDLLSGLDAGTLDLALGTFGPNVGRFAKSILFMERLVWVGRAGSARDDIPTRPRLSMVRGPQPSFVDEPPLRDGLEHRIGSAPGASFPPGPSPVTIHDPLSAGAMIAGSDLVTLLPKQLATMITARGRVDILAPSDQGDIEIAMLWHSRATADPAHVWLRGIVEAAALGLG
jgi:DNA-binding transcriptional LysR family regulator